MTTSLTVCGSAGTHVGPGRACAGYLVSTDGYRLLLDCGNGSLGNLQQRVDVAEVDAILLSHLHPDHFVDIYSLYYALRFSPRGQGSVPVYAPAGAREHIGQLLGAGFSGELDTFDEVCRFQTVAAGDRLDLGPLTVTLFPANHPVETLASRIVAPDCVIAYSADSGASEAIVECALEADLFVCDATWLERDGPHPEGIHLTGRGAGEHAAQARARQLLVTHVWPRRDPAEVAREAAGVYDGAVLVAEDRHDYEPAAGRAA